MNKFASDVMARVQQKLADAVASDTATIGPPRSAFEAASPEDQQKFLEIMDALKFIESKPPVLRLGSPKMETASSSLLVNTPEPKYP